MTEECEALTLAHRRDVTFKIQAVCIMARFDALPPAVRQAIRSANFAFHPTIAERILRRGATENRCVAVIKAADDRLSGGPRA